MLKRVHWNADAQPYDQTLDRVLYDLRRADPDNLLLDAVSMTDILEDSDGVLLFDAMTTPFARLPRMMEMLKGAMQHFSATVKPLDMTISEPFSARGVANVSAIFSLSDGQNLSVYFHNPDTKPKNIGANDEMISWKWMLNKLDVTIVVAPERGKELNIREVARRIMKLAEKNSAAFQRANGKRAERMKKIEGLKEEVAALELELTQAQNDLEVAKLAAEDRAIKAAESKDVKFSVIEEKAGNNKFWRINATYFNVRANGMVYQTGFDGDVFKAIGPSNDGTEKSANFGNEKEAIEWVKNQARIFYGLPVEPEPSPTEAPTPQPNQAPAVNFRHAGFLIKKTSAGAWGKDGDYWVVQSIENKKREDIGEPQLEVGDHAFQSIEEAKVWAESSALQMKVDAKADRERAEKSSADAAAEAAFMADLDGFTDSMIPAQRGSALKHLRKTIFYNGSYMSIKDMIKSSVDAGWNIEFEGMKERMLTNGKLALDQKTATKIGLDYAAHLIARRGAKNQNEPKAPTPQPTPAPQDPAKAAAIAMMQAIIDGTTDPLTADLDVLEQAFTSYQDDAEVAALFERAVDVVMNAEAKATEGI